MEVVFPIHFVNVWSPKFSNSLQLRSFPVTLNVLRTPNLYNTVDSLFSITKLVSLKQASILPPSSLPSLKEKLLLCHHDKHCLYYVCSLSHGYLISLLHTKIYL